MTWRQSPTNSARRSLRGSPEVVKQFLGELIDRIEIGSDKQAQPYFWVPRLQAPDRAKRGHSRTPVRIQSNHVEQRRFELPTDVSRPARPQTTDPGLVWHLGPSDGPSPHALCHACLRSLDPVPCAHASGGPPIPGGQRRPFSTALLHGPRDFRGMSSALPWFVF